MAPSSFDQLPATSRCGTFSPLLTAYSTRISQLTRFSAEKITKQTFLNQLFFARQAAYTPHNIESAWRKCGLIPYSPELILGRFRPITAAEPLQTASNIPILPPTQAKIDDYVKQLKSGQLTPISQAKIIDDFAKLALENNSRKHVAERTNDKIIQKQKVERVAKRTKGKNKFTTEG
jgi:hypothetical protein